MRKLQPLKLYFCNINNFGDLLNIYIFKKCFEIDVEWSSSQKCDAIGIGSILENELLQTKQLLPWLLDLFNPFKKPVYVLSSGFGHEDERYKKKFRFFYSMIFKRRMKFISLRGKLTRTSVEKITKKDCDNVILGDLGLLASYLLVDRKDPIYDLGICPHYADKNDPIFQEIQKKYPNSIILDTQSNPVEYIEKLSQCRCIISTGLHPLICADSLGIPNLWCRISEKTTTIHKYKDYYSIYGIEPVPYYIKNEAFSPEMVIENYKVKLAEVEKIKSELLSHHKKFFEELIF